MSKAIIDIEPRASHWHVRCESCYPTVSANVPTKSDAVTWREEHRREVHPAGVRVVGRDNQRYRLPTVAARTVAAAELTRRIVEK